MWPMSCVTKTVRDRFFNSAVLKVWIACMWGAGMIVAGPPPAAAQVDPGLGRLLPVEADPQQGGAAAVASRAAQSQAETAARAVVASSPVVALLDFNTSTLESGNVEALSQALWSRLLQQRIRMLPRKPTRNYLIRNDLHPFTPYMPKVPMSEVARNLRADFVVSGNIDRIEDTYAMDLNIYSNRAGGSILREADLRQADLNDMLDHMDRLAGQLDVAMAREASETTPAVRTRVSSPGAVLHLPRTTKRREDPLKTRTAPPAVASREDQPTPRITPTPTPTPTPAATPKVTIPADRPEPRATPSARPTPQPEPTAAPTEPAAAAMYQQALSAPAGSPERLNMLKKAVKLAPGEVQYRRVLASAYYRRNKYAESIEQCDAALQIAPGESLVLTIKGSALLELDQHPSALHVFEQAIEGDPTNYWARYNRALTLTRMERTEAAIEAWESYLSKAEGDVEQASWLEQARRILSRLRSSASQAPTAGAGGQGVDK